MFGDDENGMVDQSSFLHSSADVSKEYFHELSKEFGTFDAEEDDSELLKYAPPRKGSKKRPSRQLINTVRSNPEIESFYRFVAENDLRREALVILEEYLNRKKSEQGSGTRSSISDDDLLAELNKKHKELARASEKREAEEEEAEKLAALESAEEDEGDSEKPKKKRADKQIAGHKVHQKSASKTAVKKLAKCTTKKNHKEKKIKVKTASKSKNKKTDKKKSKSSKKKLPKRKR